MVTATARHDLLSMRRAIGRGAAVFCATGVVAAGLLFLHGFFSEKFHNRTGGAQWIWQSHRLASRQPVAFFATRNFELGPATGWVRIKVAAEPEYTLYLNGREIIGGAAETPFIEEFDVTRFARPGTNRIVASIRSPDGVGGFLLSVDFQPERQNQVTTGAEWRIYRRFDERLLRHDLEGAEAPMLFGRPPMGRWNYPAVRRGNPYADERFLGYPARSSVVQSSIPEVRTISGITVTSRRRSAGVLFDFGREVEGRGRFEVAARNPAAIAVRYLASEDEADTAPIRNLVVAPGEAAVVDPQRHRFRYILLLEQKAAVSVVSETPL